MSTTTTETRPMVRMADGRLVPASRPFGASKIKAKRFLICLHYYEDDRLVAEDLGLLMADLERTRDHSADIMLVRRGDAREFSPAVIGKLTAKFDRVIQYKCRRSDARSYPHAPNQMFFDLIMMLAQPPWRDDYYAFLNMETDCTPKRPGWIGEMIAAWNGRPDGKRAVGFIHDNPAPHLNGVAIYGIDFQRHAGGGRLNGASPQHAYDVFHSPSIMPLAAATPAIRFKYRQPTITPDELFADESVALYHGVKDGSARAAVRSRHITLSGAAKAPARPPVYAYAHQPADMNGVEFKAILDTWFAGWKSRGWNPITLKLTDATKHLKFESVFKAISKFPCLGSADDMRHRFFRWLALDRVGGGLIVDLDVLPGKFSPADIIRSDIGLVLSARDTEEISAAIFDKPNLEKFITAIETYDPQPEDMIGTRPHVSDMTVWGARFGEAIEPTVVNVTDSAADTKLVRFTGNALGTDRRSVAMAKFLGAST